MEKFIYLTKRNIKVYFSDKGMFFTSLITPLILLVLYATFLSNVYENSFISSIPEGITVSNKIIKSLVSGQLISSLLAVSCVTVAFTSNLLMVQDKVSGAYNDINVSPIKKSTLSLSYFFASFISTIIVNFTALIICLIYTYTQGWFYSLFDILILILDIILLTLFGCSLSSVINYKLSSQGQISAVGTIISSGYGFICGAYMPISSFSKALKNIISFLPGTYGTSLLRNHAMNAALNELSKQSNSLEFMNGLRDGIDCNIYFFDKLVPNYMMFVILISSIVLFLGIYILQNKLCRNK